jgi:predicted nucleotidyltransferase
MTKVPNRVRNLIDLYLRRLEENWIPVSQDILFGSYASGRYNEWSDIDIAIISNAFKGSRTHGQGNHGNGRAPEVTLKTHQLTPSRIKSKRMPQDLTP